MAMNPVHERGLNGITPKTLYDGRTVQYPELLYWTTVNSRRSNGWDKDHKYVVEHVQPAWGDYRVTDPTILTDGWSTFVKDVANMNHTFGVAIDVTLASSRLTIHKVEQIAERDYVLTFTTGDLGARSQTRRINYLLKDCNHYAHAVNRFKKRVREIARTLGITINVEDDRTEYIELPVKATTAPAADQEPYTIYAMWNDMKIGDSVGEDDDAFRAMRRAQEVYRSLNKVFTNVKVWVNDPRKNGVSGGVYEISDKGERVV